MWDSPVVKPSLKITSPWVLKPFPHGSCLWQPGLPTWLRDRMGIATSSDCILDNSNPSCIILLYQCIIVYPCPCYNSRTWKTICTWNTQTRIFHCVLSSSQTWCATKSEFHDILSLNADLVPGIRPFWYSWSHSSQSPCSCSGDWRCSMNAGSCRRLQHIPMDIGTYRDIIDFLGSVREQQRWNNACAAHVT